MGNARDEGDSKTGERGAENEVRGAGVEGGVEEQDTDERLDGGMDSSRGWK